jgi:hypothetical protein
MHKFLMILFDKTVGKFLRASQKVLIRNDNSQTVHDLVRQDAILTSANYAMKYFSRGIIFKSKIELWDYCIKNSKITGNKNMFEFGVYRGESINFFARRLKNSQIYGFDSFFGLEEDWYGFVGLKGDFNLNGNLPKVEKNVTLIAGWYEKTVPKFFQKFKTQISILHMDSDTYKPTKYVLNSLRNNLSTHTIIIFDEYFGYPGWQMHEHKAWTEFVQFSKIKYRMVGYTNMQIAIEIL